MGYNKRELSKIKMGEFTKPNPYKNDIITDPQGQWKFPGIPTRIPSNQITMEGVPYPVWAMPDIGEPTLMISGQDYNFPDASYVDEVPALKKGGLIKMPNKKNSKKFSRNPFATNKLFTESKLYRTGKGKVYNPNAKNYQEGGEFMELDLTPEEIQEYAKGGFVIEDISVPGLTQAQQGGAAPYKRNYDPLYDIKPQVSESTKPKNLPAVDKQITQKAIAQKQAERKAVATAIKKDPLLTEDQKTDILLSPQKLDENVHLAYPVGPDTIKESTPQSTASKAWDVVTNPFAAFEYAVRTGDVSNMPNNYNEMRMAGIDPSAGGGINPVGNALNSFTNLFDAGDKVVRNIGEGNYGEAALEAMRFLPSARFRTGLSKGPNVLPVQAALPEEELFLNSIKDLNATNLKKFINKETKLENNAGQFNMGVYDIPGHPNYLVKLENPASVATAQGIPHYPTTNFVDMMQNIQSPNIAKVANQFNNDKGMRALVLEKMQGVPPTKLTPDDFLNMPDEAVVDFYNDLKELRNNNLGFDFVGQNYFWDPVTQRAKLFDITPFAPNKSSDLFNEDPTNVFFQDEVFGGGNPYMYGKEEAGKNLKKALEQRLQFDIMNSFGDAYDDNVESVNMFTNRISELLKNQDYRKTGGVVVDDLSDDDIEYYKSQGYVIEEID